MLACLVPRLGHAQSTSVVISEVYGGGGNTGAPFVNDFVELYNMTGASINLDGYSLQYNPAMGGGSYIAAPLGNVNIPAHGFLLVQFGPTGTVGAALPTPDATSTLDLSATAGRVALVNNITELKNSANFNDAGIIDFVGYGGTPLTFEGAGPALGASSTVSIERKARAGSTTASMAAGGDDAGQGNGYDSDNNNVDFVTRATPGPQNSASAPEVFTPIVVYYNTKNPTGALNSLATFSDNLAGTGNSPASFSGNFQIFHIIGAGRTITGNWTVSGVGSKVVVQTAASFTVPTTANFTGLLDLSSGATLVEANPAPAVIFGSVDAASTVEYVQATAYTVPVIGGAGYGNLTLRNATKLLDAGTTIVRGNLLVSNVGTTGADVFGGATAPSSILNLGGNLTLAGTVRFSASGTDRISLVATNLTTAQVLDGGSNSIKLYKLTLPTGQAGVSLANGTSNLELGNSTGGGYQLATGTVLTVNNNLLSFVTGSGAAITSGGTNTGALALNPSSSLAFSKSSATGIGTLQLTPGSTQLTNLTVDLAGTGTILTLPVSLTVSGTLTLIKGSLAIGANTLTLNGPMNNTAGLLRGGPSSNLLIGGTGVLNTLSFAGGANGQLQNFILNRTGQTLGLGTDLMVNTALTLTNGTLSIGSNALTLNGEVSSSPTGGQFVGISTSSLIVGGASTVATVAFTPAGGILNALTLNRPNGTLTLAGTTLQIKSPTLTSGVLSIGTSMTLTITGALTVANAAVARFAGTPTSGLSFTGTGPMGNVAFVAGQDRILNLTMSRNASPSTGGVVPTVQLLTGLTVGSLTMTRGKIFVQGTNKLVLLPGVGTPSGGANSYVNTLTAAAVTNTVTPNASLVFPLGVNGQFRPLTLSVIDLVPGTTSYTARQIEAPSPVRTLPASLLRVSQIRYYNVVPESGGTSTLQSATVKLNYVYANDLVTAGNQNHLRVAMTDPADPTRWANIGGAGAGLTITSAAFAAGPLGDFTLATDITTPTNTNPLPVELVRFEATRQANGVRLNWATASEKNSASFDVQRSLNGQTFATVLRTAAQGNSTQPTAYTGTDATAPASRLYYRLRQLDLDGTVAYSTVVTVTGTDAALTELAVYPNPTTGRLTATLPAAEGRTYRVLNALSQVQRQGLAEAANPTVEVGQLPAGLYFLELRTATGSQVRRFVKND